MIFYETVPLYQFIAFSIDFEGSISIRKSFRKNGNFQYSSSVKIWNDSIQLLKEFKNIIKFGHIPNGRFREHYKNMRYNWSMNIEEMRKYLPLIQPYLILKQRQAELVIELLSILKNIKFTNKLSTQERREIYSWEEICVLESCYQECKKLNTEKKL